VGGAYDGEDGGAIDCAYSWRNCPARCLLADGLPLVNAISLKMVEAEEKPFSLKVTPLLNAPIYTDTEACPSYIGHADTAKILGVRYNRKELKLRINDKCVVAQLEGGRLPEGATELPEGFKFKFYLIEVIDHPVDYSVSRPPTGGVNTSPTHL